VAVMSVEGKFVFDAANHRDFLGACLGTGIDRSKVSPPPPRSHPVSPDVMGSTTVCNVASLPLHRP